MDQEKFFGGVGVTNGARILRSESHCSRVASRDGFTLIELMLAMSILVVLLLAWMSVLLESFTLIRVTDGQIASVNEAQLVMNQIRGANLDSADFPANVTTAFPAGELDPARATLANEVVTITYTDANGVADITANPLFVTVAVQYIGSNGRLFTDTLSAVLTDF